MSDSNKCEVHGEKLKRRIKGKCAMATQSPSFIIPETQMRFRLKFSVRLAYLLKAFDMSRMSSVICQYRWSD